jgi:hypothetical protein
LGDDPAMTADRGLLHELWEWPDGGITLSLFCIAGPRGDEARATLPRTAKLAWTTWARSHFEAMSLLHARIGPEPHTSEEPWDPEPYPQAWIDQQRAVLD